MHGPAELLPISSSGHVELVPWLLGWDEYTQAPPRVRKTFEVALHAGTAAALALARRRQLARALRAADRTRIQVAALALIVPSAAGVALERPIERRLGSPRGIATGLVAGGALIAWADRLPGHRDRAEASAADGVWLGVAQACALIPGVSRGGATLIVARARGFARADAQRLSDEAALPVICGAAALKLVRGLREGLPRALRARLALGAAAAFASTLVCTRVFGRSAGARPLWPFALYRAALGALVLRRVARERRATMRR